MQKQNARFNKATTMVTWTFIFGLIAWSGHHDEHWKLIPLLIYCVAFGVVMSMLFHRVQAAINRRLVILKLESVNPRPTRWYRMLDFAGSAAFLTLLNFFVYAKCESLTRLTMSVVIGTGSAVVLAFYKQILRRRRKSRLKKRAS